MTIEGKGVGDTLLASLGAPVTTATGEVEGIKVGLSVTTKVVGNVVGPSVTAIVGSIVGK